MGKEVRIFGIPVYEVREKENRNFTNVGTLSDPSQALLDALKAFGANTSGGVPVTVDSALTLTAVWRAVNVLSGTMASLPLHVYKSEEGSRKQIKAHKIAKLLKNPSKLMNAFMFRETMQAVLLMYGNAYAVIRKDSNGIPNELILVHPNDVLPMKNGGMLIYKVRIETEYLIIDQKDMIHLAGVGFDGLVGKSPIRIMAESLGVALNAQRYGNNFFANGAHISGVIETPQELNDETYKRLRDSWNKAYTGIDNSSKTAILDAGMKFSKIGVPPEEAQFLQTRQFQVSEVARMFGVQPHLLMDLERSTNNNIEHQGIEFVTFTLMPWISRWEAELNAKLFTSNEKEDHYTEFNVNGLLRGDAKSRGDLYRTLFNIAAMNPNEIRQLENLPAYEGGEEYFVQGANVPISKLDSFYTNKINKNVKTD
jgi:HK97 family phage portal protein